ncbi:DUF4856 domain-containing protein [Hymenobacter lutimineralis]|uniref:DUF4856 domain-containing protein n=1 Tax=Hymenobacter lutimineralis TaxID=2606448 RepID=A0A5D6V7T4_9BACT|nr:DUF4856 domain-containing protein [Hymenobacter lutimineralis]TYZ10978.1 DUF4856 domain-containing protein [Hymenobacter lutimineralis]
MTFRFAAVALLALSFGFTSCDKDDSETAPALRAKMDTSTLTASSKYTESFKDASGQSTVDLTAANQRLDMFTEFNTYMAQVAVAAPAVPATLDEAKLRGLYANTGGYFTTAELNTSGLSLRGSTAASFPATNAEAARTYIEQSISQLATASQSVNNVATPGNAGRLGRYLVDANGYEVNQVIQKALIGAVLLDQINNLLLTDNALKADNSKVVAGKTYSELEHNWDLAYGFLTKNAIMTTDIAATPRERFLAGYLNEKNGQASPAVYMAFLKGRAAIVNNDAAGVKAQAEIIRTELEKTIALAAVSYLNNWKAASALDVKAHALGEGLGFIYSLRFCTKYGADAAFSDNLLAGLMSGSQGAWSLTNAQADAAVNAIKAKFNIQ